LACGALTVTGSQSAWALDKYLDLEPPETLSGNGYGYNSISREFVLRKCVNFGTALTSDGSGASGDDLHYSFVTTNDQLADAMDLSVRTKFSMSMGVASVSASAKVKFFQETKTNFSTLTILASYNMVEPMKYIAGDISLKPEYLAMVGTPQFRAQCGDYLIIGQQSGRWLDGTVQLIAKDTTTASRLAVGGVLEGEYGTASASVGVDTLNKMKNSSNSKDLQIRLTSSGAGSAPLSVDDFIKVVKEFPGKNGPKQTYKLKAVPYESIVANWPPSNPLAPITAEQKLNAVAEAAWGLSALTEDSDFVTQNPGLFATGTTPAKRDARIAHIKARRAFYQGSLSSMRNIAKNCDAEWTSACESLYAKWKDWESFAVAEYEQFPVRYVSDCYTPREITLAGQSIKDTIEGVIKVPGQFRNTKGDRQVGGGPVGFSAYLDFKPNFSGGDPLAATKLLATLRMKMEEKGADHTTFENTVNVDVADISKPDLSSGAPVTLQQCAYKGLGVRAPQVPMSSSVCDALKPFGGPMYENCKDAVASQKHHGMLFAKAREDAEVENFTSGGVGVVKSMKCQVDKLDGDNGNDTPFLGCSNIGLLAIQYDLVNKQDLSADAWVAPKDALTVITPKGMQAASALTAAIRKNRVKPTPLKLRAGTRTACVAPLVSIGNGECAPPLKR
jgi:hypothetical protein